MERITLTPSPDATEYHLHEAKKPHSPLRSQRQSVYLQSMEDAWLNREIPATEYFEAQKKYGLDYVQVMVALARIAGEAPPLQKASRVNRWAKPEAFIYSIPRTQTIYTRPAVKR